MNEQSSYRFTVVLCCVALLCTSMLYLVMSSCFVVVVPHKLPLKPSSLLSSFCRCDAEAGCAIDSISLFVCSSVSGIAIEVVAAS